MDATPNFFRDIASSFVSDAKPLFCQGPSIVTCTVSFQFVEKTCAAFSETKTISVVFTLSIGAGIYIILPTILLLFINNTAKWTFFECLYCVIISLTTIGFGDYVPGMAMQSMWFGFLRLHLFEAFLSYKIRTVKYRNRIFDKCGQLKRVLTSI